MKLSQKIIKVRKEIEQNIVELLQESESDFTLDDVKKVIYEETGNEDMEKALMMFDNGDLNTIEEALDILNDAWNYFPHKLLNGLSPAELLNKRNEPVIIEDEPRNKKAWDPIESRVRDDGDSIFESMTMVLSEAGSVNGKFRYYVVLGLVREFEKQEKENFLDILSTSDLAEFVEVDSLKVNKTHILLSLLIPPTIAPADYLDQVLDNSLNSNLPLQNSFYITNVSKPTEKEISDYLKNFSNN